MVEFSRNRQPTTAPFLPDRHQHISCTTPLYKTSAFDGRDGTALREKGLSRVSLYENYHKDSLS